MSQPDRTGPAARDRLAEVSIDYVDSKGFSPATGPWIKELVEALDGSPSGDVIIKAETAALLFFILRALPEEDFPGAKWATIQHLEGQIEKVVREGLSRLAD